MHLLTVNVDYVYSPIYALGVVTAYDRFMNGYRPEADQASIFTALCKSVECDGSTLRQDSDRLLASLSGLTWENLTAIDLTGNLTGDLQLALATVSNNPKFKYSRLFAIGLYTLLEKIDPEKVKNIEALNGALAKVSETLNLSADKVQKDLELYRSNLEKIVTAQGVMADILAADRKKREQREQEKAAKAEATKAESEAPTEAPKNEITEV